MEKRDDTQIEERLFIRFENLCAEQWQELHTFLMDGYNAEYHFATANGIRVTSIAYHSAEGEMRVEPHHLNSAGIVHGGCLATLADTVAGIAVSSMGTGCITVSSDMHYFKPAVSGVIRCVATPERVGKSIAVIRATITSEEDVMLAMGTFTFQILRNAPPTALELKWYEKHPEWKENN